MFFPATFQFTRRSSTPTNELTVDVRQVAAAVRVDGYLERVGDSDDVAEGQGVHT